MPDIDQLIKNVKEFFQLIGATVPSWLGGVIALLIVLYLLSKAISSSLSFLNTVKNGWSQLRNPEERRRCQRRQTFAEHIKHTIRQLDLKEEWKDKRFAELEAEVEAEGHYRMSSLLPFSRTRSGLRRERSLSKALASSRDRLILLEGEPGSGKSVALRHVVSVMAEEAQRSRNLKSIIPIYVNLKELDRAADVAVDRNRIELFVLESLKRTKDRDIDQFLDDEFQQGIRDGTWFFIFDSFDEIPDVLSSTEVDPVVRSYGDAIDDFLHGMNNRCHGVVASRQFRGPAYLRGLEWATFRILPLSEERRRELIQRVDLAPKLASELVGQLGNANPDIRSMASNPLFLALLCEYMKSGKRFPSNTHTVFETYIENRLTRDQVRLQRRFSLDTTLIRATAENIAFCMTADTGIGLSPTRGDLQDALARQQMAVPDNFHTLLDALEYIKLARSDEVATTGPARPFTFAHRRFQEYFATCVVLRETARITAIELLTNARWRETAVVLCQTQLADKLAPLLEQAEQLLTQFGRLVPDLIGDPLDYVREQEQDTTSKRVANQSGQRSDQEQQMLREFFLWPSGLSHLLSILQEGFLSRLTDLPETVRTLIGSLVLSATEERPLYDRKWALEVAGAASERILVYLLNQAFSHPSQELKEVAYRQTAYPSALPPSITRTICRVIIGLSLSRRLRRERYTTQAHLARLPRSPVDFLSIMQLLLWLPLIDFIWLFVLVLCGLPAILQLQQGVTIFFQQPNFVLEYLGSYGFILLMVFTSYVFIWYRPPLRPANYIYNVHSDMPYLSYRGISQLRWPIAIRFMFVPFLASLPFAIPGSYWRPDSTIVVLICMQALSLVPLALIAAGTGTIKSWLPWILVPFWQVIWLISYLPSRLLSLIASLFRKETYMPFASLFRKETYMPFVRGPLLSVVKGVLGLAILAGTLAILAGASIVFSFVSNFVSNLFTILFTIIFIIAGLFILYCIVIYKIYKPSVIRSIYKSIHQSFEEARRPRKLWEAFIKDARGEVTCWEWWETIEKYNSYTLASEKEVIRSTREKRLLAATEETENFIKFLAAGTEAKLQNMTFNPGITVLDIQSANYQQFLQNVNADVLDELNRLLEDVHSRRQGIAYEQP